MPRRRSQRDEAPPEALTQLFEAILRQPKVQEMIDKASGLVDKASGALDNVLAGKVGPRPAQHTPPPRKAGSSLEDARRIMGFEVSAKLTAKIVKDRRRELAKIYHPDKEGSSEQMKRINEAAQSLLSALKA